MIKTFVNKIQYVLNFAPWLQALALLAARLWIAKIFFMSGLTKIKSWNTTIALFADEYNVPVLPPEMAAYMATFAELTRSGKFGADCWVWKQLRSSKA